MWIKNVCFYCIDTAFKGKIDYNTMVQIELGNITINKYYQGINGICVNNYLNQTDKMMINFINEEHILLLVEK